MVEVRLMQMVDVKAVFDLEKKIFGSADIDSIEKTLENDNLNYFVLTENEKVVGFLEGLTIAPEAEIYDVAIDEDFQRKGFGSLLLNEFVSYSRKLNCETIFLEVNNINTKAIGLYKKFNFEVYGTRKNYYGDNDAILMKLNLN